MDTPEITDETPAPRASSADNTVSENSIRSVSKNDITQAELGKPQAKVIEKYGSPVAYVMNKNGQTLIFKNGASVFVKNGIVSAPGK